MNVFPTYVIGLLLEQDVDFSIEVDIGPHPISIMS